jgi:polyhydroxyalkanoate synthesis regulator phasin
VSAEPERRTDAGRGPFEQLLLAAVGWASLTAEAADELADDLARRVGIDRDEMRGAVSDALTGWRRDAERIGSRRAEALDRALARLGLVRREEHDDLALRVAQLEHRVKLLEREGTQGSPTGPSFSATSS